MAVRSSHVVTDDDGYCSHRGSRRRVPAFGDRQVRTRSWHSPCFHVLSRRVSPADASSSHRAIENLIAAYSELVDDGDFAAVANLLADATFTGGAGSVSGRDAIEVMLRENVIVYADGTPRTKHVTTNVSIEVDDKAGTAVSRSYFTVLQALPDLPLQAVASGRYHDRFELHDEQWRFVERRVRTDLVGDLSRHLRREQ
jgi:3-phenylpropionate/cinnamic acid dioxygenase small subunit